MFKKKNKVVSFSSFILLEGSAFSMQKLAAELHSIPSSENNEELNLSIEEVDVFISKISKPVPNKQAVISAQTNCFWADAVAVAQSHTEHLAITVSSKDKSATEVGSVMVKICCSCLKQKSCTGVNTLRTVLPTDFYLQIAEDAFSRQIFPLMNLIFFGVYTQDGSSVCGYTYGMRNFGKDEIEILNSKHSTTEVIDFLTEVSGEMIAGNITPQHGETIGFSEEQKLLIRKSKGVAVYGNTLKIGF